MILPVQRHITQSFQPVILLDYITPAAYSNFFILFFRKISYATIVLLEKLASPAYK
jgi:hypothetical protein